MSRSWLRAPVRVWRRWRGPRTPIVIQLEAVECGSAALGAVLAHYGRHVSAEQLRAACGVSRDGSTASGVLRAARRYGLTAKGMRCEPAALPRLGLPAILFWEFSHFVVLERLTDSRARLNDPAVGRRQVSRAEFDTAFTGVALTFTPGPDFRTGGERYRLLPALAGRVRDAAGALPPLALLTMVLVALALIAPMLARVFVDRVLAAGAAAVDGTLVVTTIAAAGLLTVLAALCQQRLLVRSEYGVVVRQSERLMGHLLRLPIDYFTQRQAADLTRRVRSVDLVADAVTRQLSGVATNVLLALGYAVLLCWYDPVLGMGMLLLAGLDVVVLRISVVRRMAAAAAVEAAHTRRSSLVYGTVEMIESIKAAGREDDRFAELAREQAATLSAEQRAVAPLVVLSAAPPVVTALSTVLLVVVGSDHVASGVVTVGALVAMQGMLAALAGPLQSLTGTATRLQQLDADLARLRDIGQARPVPVTSGPYRRIRSGELRADRIEFGYTPGGAPAVSGFSVHVAPGDRVALVGATGSGKSTIARLLAGLYQPWSGTITVAGLSRAEVDAAHWAAKVAMVDQLPMLFSGTVRDNVTMWDPEIADSAVLRALRIAELDQEVMARPGGLTAVVAERGANFSGGQRQRLELARALARHPTVLVLDEATSALDPETELRVDHHLRDIGVACFIVAHRLSTIRDAELIVVLDEGREVDRGTHRSLLRSSATYRRLIRASE
jgi:NHLM bacteriocin system ABC transporter peptidase/ATP-binding protein